MKAGLLLPRSNVYPGIAGDFTVALRLCLRQAGNEEAVTFVSENVGFGGVEKEVYDKAEKLLLVENVDILIAYIDIKVMPMLEPLIFSTGKLLIVLNAGANFPEKKIPQPGIIYITLQHSFLCAKTGHAAGNANGIYATCFYDCGYMHGAALIEGFTQNHGNIVFNYVNRDKYDETFAITALTEFLQTRAGESINLLCIFDETPARLFYEKLNEYEHADRLRLFVSPRMLTKHALVAGGYRFTLEGYTGWLPETGGESNKNFMTLYDSFKKEPSVFSLAGLHAGLVLNELLQSNETVLPAEESVALLQEKMLNAPGTDLVLDADTNFYIATTIYKCVLPAGGKELIISAEETHKADWDRFVQGQNDLPSSGWTNTYLCY